MWWHFVGGFCIGIFTMGILDIVAVKFLRKVYKKAIERLEAENRKLNDWIRKENEENR